MCYYGFYSQFVIYTYCHNSIESLLSIWGLYPADYVISQNFIIFKFLIILGSLLKVIILVVGGLFFSLYKLILIAFLDALGYIDRLVIVVPLCE